MRNDELNELLLALPEETLERLSKAASEQVKAGYRASLKRLSNLVESLVSPHMSDRASNEMVTILAEMLMKHIVVTALTDNDLAFITQSFDALRNDAIRQFHKLFALKDNEIVKEKLSYVDKLGIKLSKEG